MGTDRAALLLVETLPESPLFNVAGWPRWRELLPHVMALTEHITPDQDTPRNRGHPARRVRS